MKVDIVIKSFAPDYGWLAFCLRSIQKFATGFNKVIVMLPRSAPLTLTAEDVVLLDSSESYLSQQVAKLNADHHSEADYILHIDSDCCLTAPLTPDYFFKNGKPIWVITPFDAAPEDEKKAWLHVMVKCLRQMPPYEFMRKNVLIVPRFLYIEFRKFIEQVHGCSMDAYVMSQPGREFSEYNCLGFFAWLKHRDVFYWHDTTIDGVPEWPFRQGWSWGGLTSKIREELEGILR